jgi:hypothetical protein
VRLTTDELWPLHQATLDPGIYLFAVRGVGHTYFRIQCLASDNAGLPPGNYKERLVLQLTGKEVPRVLESLFIDFDIDL